MWSTWRLGNPGTIRCVTYEPELIVPTMPPLQEVVQMEGDTNLAVPYWRSVSKNLDSFSSCFQKPLEEFSKLFESTDEETELWLCACCFVWIPFWMVYMCLFAAVFAALSTVAFCIGYIQALIFLAIGVWPGLVVAVRVILLSIWRLPWNLFYHLDITWRIIEQGHWIKAASVFLLLPCHLLAPLLISLASTSCIVTSATIASIGCPYTPWKRMGSAYTSFKELYVTNVEEKVKKYNPDDGGNYGTSYWKLVEEVLSGLFPLMNTPQPYMERAAAVKGCGVAKGIIIVFVLFWAPLPALYFLVGGIIYIVFTATFFVIGTAQSLIHIIFGFFPGILIGLDASAIGIFRLCGNTRIHLSLILCNLKAGHFIRAANLTILVPVQVLLPVLVSMVGITIGFLVSILISLFGFPQLPWHKLEEVHNTMWMKLHTEIEKKAEQYSAGTREEYLKANLVLPYWQALGELLTQLESLFKCPMPYLVETKEIPIRKILSAPLWALFGAIYMLACTLSFLVVALPLAIFGLLQSILQFAIGIWPGFLIGIIFTVITTIRLPWNIYYHCLITYRTVMLRRNLKVLSFIVVPPTHLLVPPIIALLSFGGAVPTCSAVSFVGYPHRTWPKVCNLAQKFWKRYVTDVRAHVENYGHESGIPKNWDGKIYGLPVDPITIVMAILFYVYAAPPTTIGVIIILAIKMVPFVLRAVAEYWNIMNYCQAIIQWWRKVVEFAMYDACSHYARILEEYFKYIKHLKPSYVVEAVQEYLKECDFILFIKKGLKHPCDALCLSPCLLLLFFLWVMGLVSMVIMTTLFLLCGLAAWILGWAVAILLPPTIYILYWITLLFVIPICYTVAWVLGFCFTLFFPWPTTALAMLSGPFLALKVPFVVFKFNLLNPGEMDLSFKMGIRMPKDILKEVDRQTGKITLPEVTLWSQPKEEVKEVETFTDFDYWQLFYDRATEEMTKIVEKNWLTVEDIEEASATSMIAIPGITMLAVLVRSIEKEASDKSLIFWTKQHQCTERRRNKRDNISNYFFPLLVRLKNGLREQSALNRCAGFIAASFCDGSDTKTDQLKVYLGAETVSPTEKAQCLKIRAEIENVVHCLLRVKKMQEMLGKITKHSFNKKDRDSGYDFDDQEDSVSFVNETV